MSKPKTYTLELTEEEVRRIDETGRLYCSALTEKFSELVKQAARDREAGDLRLPWRVRWRVRHWRSQFGDAYVSLTMSDPCGEVSVDFPTIAYANLASAAPELLEAVKAWEEAARGIDSGLFQRARELHAKAQRKVETGVPE